jgi:hypothetical protein
MTPMQGIVGFGLGAVLLTSRAASIWANLSHQEQNSEPAALQIHQLTYKEWAARLGYPYLV